MTKKSKTRKTVKKRRTTKNRLAAVNPLLVPPRIPTIRKGRTAALCHFDYSNCHFHYAEPANLCLQSLSLPVSLPVLSIPYTLYLFYFFHLLFCSVLIIRLDSHVRHVRRAFPIGRSCGCRL